MDYGKYEFIKNFIEQKAQTSSVNSDEVLLFKNKDNVVAYITYIEFLLIDQVIKEGNEFWRSKTSIYRWLNSALNMNSNKFSGLLIGIKMNSRNISLEFFSFGYYGHDLNSRLFKNLWTKLNSFYGGHRGARIFAKLNSKKLGGLNSPASPMLNPILFYTIQNFKCFLSGGSRG